MDSETTLTTFLRGKIQVRQPKSGYRFNVDSVALAGFAWLRDGERALDLGTGSGILLLLLGYFHHPSSLTGVELQENLAAMAASNLAENGWGDRGHVLCGDLRDKEALPEGAFDLVVCNPPYHEAGRGQTSSTPQRALARQSFSAEFTDVAAAASRAMAPGGRFCVVAPVARRDDLHTALLQAGLHASVSRHVQDSPASKAHLLLLLARHLPDRGCLALPPLILKEEGGAYGPEMRRWLNHEAPAGPAFFCDCMLGTLARYLRLLGADTAYARKAEDDWLMGECNRSGRVLLTRDRPLLSRCSKADLPALDPGSDAPREQLAAVREAFPAPFPGTPRCLRCNAPITALDREEARGRVPPYTYFTRERFTACPCCGRITWEGSHLERFRKDVMSG